DLRTGLSSTFESEEYQNRRRALEEEFQERQAEALRELQEKAREQNLALLRTPAGLDFAPVRDGEVMPPDEFQKLSQEEQDRIQNIVEELQGQLERAMMQMPRWER